MADFPDDTNLRLELSLAKRVHIKNVIGAIFSILLVIAVIAGYVVSVYFIASSQIDGADKFGIIGTITLGSIFVFVFSIFCPIHYFSNEVNVSVGNYKYENKVSRLLKSKIDRDRAQMKLNRYWNEYGSNITRLD